MDGYSRVKKMVLRLAVAVAVAGTAEAGTALECSFNALADGLIDGQSGWNVYDKVKDSSAFSVMAEVGTTEKAGDKALIVQSSDVPLRCVTDEPIRWLREQTLSVEFDFKLAMPAARLAEDRPSMVFYVGNSLLNEKARWVVRMDALANGDWKLTAALPDEVSQVIPAAKLLVRSAESATVSDWFHCMVEVKKRSKLDSFSSRVKVLDRHGKLVASLECTDSNKNKVTMAMWNLSRLHAGFFSSNNLHGLACIDNLAIKSEF